MFLITNRVLHTGESGLDVFGKRPNPRGPNELRIVEANEDGTEVSVLDELLDDSELDRLEQRYGFAVDRDRNWYVSLRVACELFDGARRKSTPLLLYVHGYNNDMGDVLRSAHEIQRRYEVLVIPFSWPANGGGPVTGAASYLSDKDDARASATALQRAVEKVHCYHRLLTEGTQRRLWQRAQEDHPDDHERAHAVFAAQMANECRVSLNLLCHSMGNYVLKHAERPTGSSLRKLTFDNIVLLAADVNNAGHAEWIDEIPVRNRMYVVINEGDWALKWARLKPGDEQLARLGHHLRNLTARTAHYVDVTAADGVGEEHSYHLGPAVDQNPSLRAMFDTMFRGGGAESGMEYRSDLNAYSVA